MIEFTDDEIDLFAQTLCAGFHSDGYPGVPAVWGGLSAAAKGNWRRAARALTRHLYHGQPVNKAPHHMSELETGLIEACNEYEATRRKTDWHNVRAADFWAERIAEQYALIRRAIHAAPAAAHPADHSADDRPEGVRSLARDDP